MDLNQSTTTEIKEEISIPFNNNLDRYSSLRVVGKGSFSQVNQVRDRNSEKIYAMKVINKKKLSRKNNLKYMLNEKEILENCEHPNIIGLKECFQTGSHIYLVLEFCQGGELFYHLQNQGKFDEKLAKFYAAQILLALECLHDKNIVYRDLKPENILLTKNGDVKLTDFGLSKENIHSNKDTRTMCGTPEYLAPEVLNQTGHGKAVDLWSFGTLIFEMLTGLPPFYDVSRKKLLNKILHDPINYPKSMSTEVVDLLEKLFERDPDRRLGADQRGVQAIKEHPWFNEIDWDSLSSGKSNPPYVPLLQGEHDLSWFDEHWLGLNPQFAEE